MMATEIQDLGLGFDYAFLVKNFIEELLGRKILQEAMLDSKNVFNVVAKDGKTADRRLQIDFLGLQ